MQKVAVTSGKYLNIAKNVLCEVDTGSFQNDMTSMKSKDDVLKLLIHLGYLDYNEDKLAVRIPNAEIQQEFVRVVRNGKCA